MKISKITLQNVKSFCNETIIEDFEKRLNLFVGPNASGKSNLFEIVQTVLNDCVMVNISIVRGDQTKAYKIEPANAPPVSFDTYLPSCEHPQNIVITLEIEKDDIASIKTIGDSLDKLSTFEQNRTGTTYLTSMLRQINFDGKFEALVGKTLEIEYKDSSIKIPENQEDVPYKDFYLWFSYSNMLTTYINCLYNLENDEQIEFNPYFLYLTPYRAAFDVPRESQILELASGNLDNIFYRQQGLTSIQQISFYELARTKFAVNETMGRQALNKPYQEKLRDFLGVEFRIETISDLQRRYKVNLFRKGTDMPARMSSGEKELMNLISMHFVHPVHSGLVLIDEPELHLHPTWQRTFLNYTQESADSSNTQYFMVTHSPHLVTDRTIRSVRRVHKSLEDKQSKLTKPSKEYLESLPAKKVFHIVNTLNNERIFFSNLVILVEGVTDRIVFEHLTKLIQSTDDKSEVSVVDIGGKGAFPDFQKYLDSFGIPFAFVTDLDYLHDDSEGKELFDVDSSKRDEAVKEGKSNDITGLLKLLDETFSDGEKPKREDCEQVKELWKYLQNRLSRVRLKSEKDAGKKLDALIEKLKSDNIYVIRNGSIEDYFGLTHFDVGKALEVTKALNKPAEGTKDLFSIIQQILEGNHIKINQPKK